jgi:hypothetical protein
MNRLYLQSLSAFSVYAACFLGLIFKPENGNDIFPLNVLLLQWTTGRFVPKDIKLPSHRCWILEHILLFYYL